MTADDNDELGKQILQISLAYPTHKIAHLLRFILHTYINSHFRALICLNFIQPSFPRFLISKNFLIHLDIDDGFIVGSWLFYPLLPG